MRQQPKSSILTFPTLAAVAALVLAGCGSTASLAPSAGPAAATTADSQTLDSGSIAPFATTDCSIAGPPVSSESAPVDGQEFEGIFIQSSDSGAPIVTIPATVAPVTDLTTYDLASGKGDQVKSGSTLTVNYCGIGLASRTLFDSSWVRGEPATFPLDGLIQGWIDGLPGMAVGGERLLLIPGSLAYGPNPPEGSGIGPDETLLFIVQLTEIS